MQGINAIKLSGQPWSVFELHPTLSPLPFPTSSLDGKPS